MIDVTPHISNEVSRIVKLIGKSYIKECRKAQQKIGDVGGKHD